MNKLIKIILIVIILFVICITTLLIIGLTWLSQRNEAIAEKTDFIANIEQYPKSIKTNTFTSSYPDATPSASITYDVPAAPTIVFDFYKKLAIKNSWEITKEDSDSPYKSVTKTLYLLIPEKQYSLMIGVSDSNPYDSATLKNGGSKVFINIDF